MTKRALIAALLAASAGLAPRAVLAQDKSREIMVWAMGEEGKKIEDLARRFEELNPGVKVNTQAIPWDAAHEKLLTSVVGDIPPDVCQMGTTWMAEFASMGALEDVDARLADSKAVKPEFFFRGSWDTCVVKGKTYGVPWYVDTRVLFFRKDLLQRAGFNHPPATWDEMKDVSRALLKLPGLPTPHYAFTLGVKDWGALLMYVWQNGGEALKPTSKAFREAFDYYVSFFREGLVPSNISSDVDLLQSFKTGYFPMFISGPWMVDLIQKDAPELEGKWGVAVLPRKVTPTSFIGGSNLVVFKGSRRKDLAWQFVEFMSRPDVQLDWYRIMKDLPSNRSAWNAPEFQKNAQLKVFGEQLKYTQTPPNIPSWEELAQPISTTLEKAILSQHTSANLWQIEMDQLQLKADTIELRRTPSRSRWGMLVFGFLAVLSTGALLLWGAYRKKKDPAIPQEDEAKSFRDSPKAGYAFILPAVALLVVFLFIPICVSFFLSLTDLDVYGINDWKSIHFIGLGNYQAVLRDPIFWKTLFNTFYFAVVGVPLTIAAALLTAVALNQNFLKFRTFFRAAFFSPVVTTIVAVAVVWRWLYNPDFGLLNWILSVFHLPKLSWLSDVRTALFSLILMAVWKNFGYYMVIFSAGLQTIPESLYEAARIDGANSWQSFRYITLPGLRPTTLFVTVLTVITYLQFFAEPYIMTKGGPLDSTNSIVLYMYNNGFKFFKLGYASAVAYILFGIIFLLTLAQLRWKNEGFEAGR